MSKRARWLLPVAIIGVAVFVAAGLIKSRPEPPKKDTPPTQPLVEVEPARPFAGEFILTAQGTVAPHTGTTLVSEVNGAVVEVSDSFQVGNFFRRGEVLLRIDAKDYQAALRRAEAQVANRQALLAQEQARADQARRDWENLRRPGTPSDLVLRVPYVAEAQANLRSAEADLLQARINLERTVVRAPYDGLLREKRVDLGQYLGTGTAVAVVNAIDRAEVRVPLTSLDAAFLPLPGPGDEPHPVTLRASVGGEQQRWPARLVRSENVIDERSRVLYAVVSVDDPYGVLGRRNGPPLPFGTFVEVDLPATIGHQVVGVPRHAVRGSNQLMTVDADGRLRLREVVIVRADTSHAFIDGGLEPGERVVVSTLDAPVDGMAVRTRDPGLGLDTAVAQVPANRNTLDEFGVDETVAADEDADLRSGDGGERDGE
ncbi:MAG: efflux RND transporter periplasmic adaptor subunit [Pseudoxanthomonas sp.]|nr:efflux RND transporter periplasmic adaptor subunit [Pseudoxanthomonas sp.]